MANKTSHNIKIMSDCLLLLTSKTLLRNAARSEHVWSTSNTAPSCHRILKA